MTFRPRIGSFLIVSVSLLSLLSFVSGARAAVVVGDLGSLSVGSSPNFGTVTPALGTGPTDGEIYSFELTGTASINASATSISVPAFVGIEDFQISLVRSTNGTDFGGGFDTIVSSPLSGDNVALAYADLDPTKLWGILVQGNVTGILFGSYVGTLSVVPLPPALWLFLSALVGLVAVVRHKRQKNPAGLAPEPAVAA